MKEQCGIDRRTFLKTSTISAAGLSVVGMGLENAIASTSSWADKSPINPDIPNTRVICCYDTRITKNQSTANTATTLLAQNNALNTAQVESDLDEMAVRLARKSTASAAWAAIFRKADAKQWSQVKVAIKVNCIYEMIMPRPAIIGKVCKELINIGVSAENITIYDACHDASGNTKYTPFIGTALPAKVKVQSGRGATASVSTSEGNMTCTQAVTNADILVNCAVNKGHGQNDKGGFTLTMKNHTGTMMFGCPSLDEMIAENRCDAIIGGAIPRQQLCIVDSIWAARTGPFDQPTHLPCRIVMGTFGPAVDIMTARKIRETVMKATHNESAIAAIASGFGYKETDFEWEEFTPSDTDVVIEGKTITSFSDITFTIKGRHSLENAAIDFQIPSGKTITGASVLTLSGKVIKALPSSSLTGNGIVWDGVDTAGKDVIPGIYVIKITADRFSDAKPFRLLNR